MTGLGVRAACDEVHRKLGLPTRRLPQVCHMRRLAIDLAGAGNGLEGPPKAPDWNEIAGRLLGLLHQDVRLSPTELRKAAWCLWRTDPALVRSAPALTAVLRQMSEAGSRKPFRAFASSFVASFSSECAAIEVVGHALAEEARRWGPPWQRLQEEYSFFHPAEGPKRIARAVLADGGSVVDVLRTHGLGAVAAEGGYAKAVTAALLADLANGADLDHIARLARVRALALRPDGSLLFDDQAVLVAEALLKPFLEGDDGTNVSGQFLPVVLRLYGDPRIHPGRWHRLGRLNVVVRKWLTFATISQFLDVVEETADERMFRHRRAFWEAAMREGLISDAWVVLGSSAVELARRVFGSKESFAQFSGRGCRYLRPNQSVLLLRIGRGLVAEWSHNGKVHVWTDADDETAPRMFSRYYDADDVRIESGREDVVTDRYLSISHRYPEKYWWQNTVAGRIYNMTGYRMQQISYAVR